MTRLPTHRLGRLVLLLALTPFAGCDGGTDEPDARSLAGTYTLVRYGGAPLPNGGVTAGALRLRIDQTIPVYDTEWTSNGTRVTRSGLYTVSGNAVEFTQTSGSALVTYAGAVDEDRITVSLNDGTFTTFTFERP